jgi:hypothetical protein
MLCDRLEASHDYVGHLSTISAYLQLPASEQEQIYGRIVLPESVEVGGYHRASRTLALRVLSRWEMSGPPFPFGVLSGA